MRWGGGEGVGGQCHLVKVEAMVEHQWPTGAATGSPSMGCCGRASEGAALAKPSDNLAL